MFNGEVKACREAAQSAETTGDVKKANGDGTATTFDDEDEGFCREVSLDGDEVGREGGEPRQIARTSTTSMTFYCLRAWIYTGCLLIVLDSVIRPCIES